MYFKQLQIFQRLGRTIKGNKVVTWIYNEKTKMMMQDMIKSDLQV